MQTLKKGFLPVVFLIVSFFSTAFIVNSTQKASTVVPIAVEVPPQYETQKLSFFERVMLKRLFKKAKTKRETDPDVVARDAAFFSKIGVVLLIISALFVIPGLIFQFFLSLSLLTAVAASIFSYLAIRKSKFILSYPRVTASQEKTAQHVRANGFCGLIIGVVLIGLIAYAIKTLGGIN
jgi:hypothetical protein